MRISDWSSDVCSSDLVEKIGHVETDERRLQRQSVDLIVEHPAERTAPRPFLQPGTNAFRVALTEQLAQRENGPVLRREASKRGQPLVDHTLLCDAELASDRRHQLADQAPQKDKIARTIVECPQGRETCRLPILQRQQ